MAHKKSGKAHGGHGEEAMHSSQESARRASKGGMDSGLQVGTGFVEGHEEMVGRHDVAGFPQDVKMKQYPRVRFPTEEGLDDSMNDIDHVEDKSEGKRKRYISFQK